ncbi:MAG: hypothetical protein ACYDAZ_01935 [Thermoplasmataceae archaeon]
MYRKEIIWSYTNILASTLSFIFLTYASFYQGHISFTEISVFLELTMVGAYPGIHVILIGNRLVSLPIAAVLVEFLLTDLLGLDGGEFIPYWLTVIVGIIAIGYCFDRPLNLKKENSDASVKRL